MQYQLRAATAGDEAFLWWLHEATMRTVVRQVWGWDEAYQRQRFRDNFAPQRVQIVIVAGRDVGAVAVERRASELFLANIAIAPGQQGGGLGTAIIRDLLAEATRAGLPLTLQVLKNNRARRLYERLGLTATGETPTHILMSTTTTPPDPAEEG